MSNIDLVKNLPNSIYRNSNIYKLWELFAFHMDELDVIFRKIAMMTNVRDNCGAQLDLLGKILRCSRKGQGDKKYTDRLLAVMRKYQSNGSIEELNTICDILLGDDFCHIRDFNMADVHYAQYLDGSKFLDGSWFLAGTLMRPRYFEVIVSNNIDDEMMSLLTEIIQSCKAGGINFGIRKVDKNGNT